MRLRSIEIQGFKSFPDKTSLTFGNGITAVVGPNGSGKSNIADAMRWVMGEQSTRTLRGVKMEDVIFGGTQTRKPVGFAMVELTIDNADGALGVEDEAVTISRRLYRSGESEYRINNAMVRLKDIHELFMDTGLGRDGYSIIGQGKIAEIVSAKSRERREIFEEAAGIAKFRYRKEEAEKRLSQAEENLLRLRDIVLELEGRVGPLKIQAEKAKAFLELATEKKSLEISLWMITLTKLKEQLAAQEDRLYLCKSRYEGLETDSEAVEAQISDIFKRAQELAAQAEEQRAAVRTMEETLAAQFARAAVLENDIRHNESSIARVNEEIGRWGMSGQELETAVQEKERTLADGSAELAQMQSRIEAAQQRAVEQEQQSARVQEEIALAQRKLDSVSDAINEERTRRATGATLLEESENRSGALRSSATALDEAVEETRANLEECITQRAELEEKIGALANTAGGYRLKREGRGRKLDEALGKAQALEKDAAAKLARAKLLEDMEAGMEGFSGSVKYVMAQTRKGALGGVFGAVSELIGTKAEYITAIETSLGAAMQNIVVKDENVAKSAIRMLKSANAGRATFLPLTSVRGGGGLDEREMSRHDGFVGSAKGLVSYDPQFEGVFSQLLGRVAVVEDLDSGAQLAKASGYRFRIVTLDGQIINSGGSFTGGSTGRSTGMLGRRHEIEQLHAKYREIKAEIAALEPGIKLLRDEVAGMDAYILGCESEKQTATEELVRLGFARESLEKSLAQAEENRERARAEMERLAKRLEELRGGEESSARLMQELEDERAGMLAQLDSAKSRQENLVIGLQSAQTTLSEQRLTLLAAQKDHDALSAEIGRVRAEISSQGERQRRLDEEKSGYESAIADIKQQIAGLETESAMLRESIAQGSETVARLLEERTAHEAQTTQLRAKERELSTQREEVSRELARLEERRLNIQGDYDAIIAKLWDEYDLTRSQAAELAQELADPDAAARRLTELRRKIKAIGTVNVEAIDEYAQVSERYEFLTAQVKDVESSKAKLTEMIAGLTHEMREIFTDNFMKIAANFSKVFVELFGGGKAELSLTQEDDVLESGVEIFVQPPGKIIKSLSLLSGGEQAFVAIAIYFAILKVRPAPFCLLDEIEAALDDVNVFKFASYLRTMCDKIQFIAITHRRGTMEEADMLYGVTMQEEGVSKLLELNVSQVESSLGIDAV